MSNAIELLKQELLLQKQAVENKGGRVVVSNINPSPSEITAGINSIQVSDLTEATATEADVLAGKTFYAGNSSLKTGTLEVGANSDDLLRTFLNQEETDNEVQRIVMPNGIKKLRSYIFNDCQKSLSIQINDDIEEIGDNAFNMASNITIENFQNLQSLKTIGNYAFNETEGGTVNVSQIPDSVEYIGEYAFAKAFTAGDSIKIPENLVEMGKYSFSSIDERVSISQLIIPDNNRITTMGAYAFSYICFNDDFRVPPLVRELQTYFNYRGSFKNVTIPATCTNVMNYAFYGSAADPAEYYYMKSLVFEAETPPTIGRTIIATHHLSNGLKIYVPDGSVEAYKAVSNLSNFKDYIYPMSQRE